MPDDSGGYSEIDGGYRTVMITAWLMLGDILERTECISYIGLKLANCTETTCYCWGIVGKRNSLTWKPKISGML